MKKRDILLAGGIVLVALVMLLVMHVTGETKGDQVQITVNGEIYGTYPLEKDQTIVCLPHKLVVEVIRQNDTDSKAAGDKLVPDTIAK